MIEHEENSDNTPKATFSANESSLEESSVEVSPDTPDLLGSSASFSSISPITNENLADTVTLHPDSENLSPSMSSSTGAPVAPILDMESIEQQGFALQQKNLEKEAAKANRSIVSFKESILAFFYLAPSIVIFSVFFFFPLFQLVYLGLHQQNRFGTADRWVGFSQFTETLTGDDFQSGLLITGKYVIFTVPLGLILGISLAVAANRRLRGIKIFHVIFSSTVGTSVAVASIIFFVLINPQVGYFKDLEFFSLANPDTALRGVAVSSIWQNLGLTFIIVLAGLQAIPDEILEATKIDGMGTFRRFFTVTVPLISPTLVFLMIVLVIFAFQAFAQIDILTAGGPAGSTQTLVFKIFNSQQPLNQGKGAVMALGLFGITMLVSTFQLVILERHAHYGDS